MLLHGDSFAYPSLSVGVPPSLCWASVRAICESHGSNTEKTRTSLGNKDWIWTGSNGKPGDDTGIENCYRREKLEVKVWLSKNKGGSQEQNIWGPADKNSVWRDSTDAI